MKIWQKLTLAWGVTSSLLGIISILTIKIDTQIQSKTNEIVHGIVRENQAAGKMFVSIQSLQALTENLLVENESNSLNSLKIKQYQQQIKERIGNLEKNLIEAKEATIVQRSLIDAYKRKSFARDLEAQEEIKNLNDLAKEFQTYKKEWEFFLQILEGDGAAAEIIAAEERIINVMNKSIVPLVSRYYEDSLAEIIESELITQKLTREHIKVIRNYALFTFILSIVLFVYLYYSIYIPIGRLKLATFRLGQDFSEYQPIKPQNPHDELGYLTRYLNETIETLKTKIIYKSYLDNIINSISQNLIVIDRDKKIEKINYNTQELLGYSEAELIGKSINFILAESNNLSIEDLIEIDDRSENCYSLEIITKEHDKKSVKVYFSSMLDGSGQKKGTICLAIEIGNLDLTDTALQQSKRKAKHNTEMTVLAKKSGEKS